MVNWNKMKQFKKTTACSSSHKRLVAGLHGFVQQSIVAEPLLLNQSYLPHCVQALPS